MKYVPTLVGLPLVLFAGAALAHPGHDTVSFMSGFAHPIGGVDHLLAMLALGLYAARQASGPRCLLPAGFIVAMLAGAALSATGVALPAVEIGIATSVLVLGLLIAFVIKLPTAAALPLVAVFAACHGHAHHAEMGEGSLLGFTIGFVLATALLHTAGYALARWMPETRVALIARRVAGAIIAGAGVLFLAS
jgi:urease accessory protein